MSMKGVRRQPACPSGHYRPLGRASLLACANTLHSFPQAKRPPGETSRAKRPPRGHLWARSHTTDARTVDAPHGKSTPLVPARWTFRTERRPPGQRSFRAKRSPRGRRWARCDPTGRHAVDVSRGTSNFWGTLCKVLHELRERPYQAGGSAQIDTLVGV